MSQYCPNCRKLVDDQLVVCPDCKGSLSDQISSLQTLTKEQLGYITNKVVTQTTSRMVKMLWGGFAVIAAGSFLFSWWNLEIIHKKSVKYLENKLTARIEAEFETKRIRDTVTGVAEHQTKLIIRDKLEPSIKEATDLVDKKTGEFEEILNEFTTKYDAETNILAEEVGILKLRNTIMKLGDEAIATGKAAPYDKLFEIYSTSENEYERLLAQSTIHQIKGQFGVMTRMANTELVYNHPDPKQTFKENEIPTEALIEGYPKIKNWKYRGRAIQLLASRKEPGVPECILSAMKDEHLEVRKISIQSFERVTGWKSNDTFGFGEDLEKKWWTENKERVEKDFKELQTIEDAIKKRTERKNSSEKK